MIKRKVPKHQTGGKNGNVPRNVQVPEPKPRIKKGSPRRKLKKKLHPPPNWGGKTEKGGKVIERQQPHTTGGE